MEWVGSDLTPGEGTVMTAPKKKSGIKATLFGTAIAALPLLAAPSVIRGLAGDAWVSHYQALAALPRRATAGKSWQDFGGWMNGDFDSSGFVDVRDMLLMANNWYVGVLGASFDEAAQSQGLPSSSVPEPTALWLLMTAVPLLRRRRR